MNAPSYAQIDLGNEYPVSKVNFWNYWDDGRTLKDLRIILSTTENFQTGTTKRSITITGKPQRLDWKRQ